MPRVDTYGPQNINSGNISSGTIDAIANTPTPGQTLVNGMKPLLEFAMKSQAQRSQLDVMSKVSQFEIDSQKKLQELQQQDLGDQDISQVFEQDLKDRVKSMRESVSPMQADFFDSQMIGTYETLAKQGIAAQAAQNANRIKNSSSTFLNNMTNGVRTNPQDIVKYDANLKNYVDTMPVSAEAKNAFMTAGKDSIYLAHAEAMGATDPAGLYKMFQAGYYNDKVSPDGLKQIAAYRDNAVKAATSEVSLDLLSARSVEEVDFLEKRLEPISAIADPVEINTIKEELQRKRNELNADQIEADKLFQKGVNLIANNTAYDVSNADHNKAVNLVYETQRNTIKQNMEHQIPSTSDAKTQQDMQDAIDQRINVQMPMDFVSKFKKLPESSVNFLVQKLGDYRDKESVMQGMQMIKLWNTINPNVKSFLPDGVKDDWAVFKEYSDKFGSEETALGYLLKSKTETEFVKKDRETKLLEADTMALETFGDLISDSTTTWGQPGGMAYRITEAVGLGTALRAVDSMFFKGFSTNEGTLIGARAADSPDAGYMEERYKQRFTQLYLNYNGDDKIASLIAKKEIQESFGVSQLMTLNVGGGFEGQLMWAPPEKVLQKYISNYGGVGSILSGENDVVRSAIMDEMKVLREPVRDADGNQMMDKDGNPMFSETALPEGANLDITKQPFRLRTTDYDRRNKSFDDFVKKPVYAVEVWVDGKWTSYPTEGKQMFIDFSKVIDKVKKNRAQKK